MKQLLLAVVLGMTACARRSPSPSQFQALAQSVRASKACRAAIPLEWAQSWPIPLDSYRFKVFFYPLTGAPPENPQVFSPGGEAVLDLKSGQVETCAIFAETMPQLLSTRRWPKNVERLDMKGFDGASARLYEKTENAARAFAEDYSQKNTLVAREYLEVFESLAEPDLLVYYYGINPAFWKWLRQRRTPAGP